MWDCLVLQVQLLSHPAWLIRAGTCSGSVCVARSQLSPVPHHWIRVLFYASSCLKGKRGCVLQARLLCYPSQYHVVLKAVFRPSCKEQDKSNVKVYWPCTAALKLSPEEETALRSCREPSNRDLGQELFRSRSYEENLTTSLLLWHSFPQQRGIPVKLMYLLVLETSHVQMLDVALSLLKKLLQLRYWPESLSDSVF